MEPNKLRGTCSEMKSGDLCEEDYVQGLFFDDLDEGREREGNEI